MAEVWFRWARTFLVVVMFVVIGSKFKELVDVALHDGKFFLMQEDEVIYYCSARLFQQTNSLQAESCINELVSPLGRFNWYGPGYNFVYGTLFKILGGQPADFVLANVMFLCGTVLVVLLLKTSLERRVLICVCILMSYPVGVYLFTYFPEPLIMFLSAILAVVLVNFSSSSSESKKRRYLVTFVVCCFLFMLVRITFIFWLAALLTFAQTRRTFFLYVVIVLTGIVISLLYMKFFTAPPFAVQMHKIGLLFEGKIAAFISATVDELTQNLKAIWLLPSLAVKTLLGLTGLSLLFGIVFRNRLALAGAVVSMLLLAVMFSYYLIHPYYFVKQTSGLIPLLLVCIIVAGDRFMLLPYAVLGMTIYSFNEVPAVVRDAIFRGRYGYDQMVSNREFEREMHKIAEFIGDESPAFVLWCYNEFPVGVTAEALMPFATAKGYPIMYTTNIVAPDADPRSKFAMHGRLPIQYIISRDSLNVDTLKELHSSPFYHLYKLPD